MSVNKLGQARQKFLEAYEQSGRKNAQALYGLGRLALHEADPDLARDHFTQATNAEADTYIKAMSHVYIGRIEDVVGNRDLAVEHYQLALDAGDASPRVRQLAQEGLNEPFGRPGEEEEEDEPNLDEDEEEFDEDEPEQTEPQR